jgi:hypothetical protein
MILVIFLRFFSGFHNQPCCSYTLCLQNFVVINVLNFMNVIVRLLMQFEKDIGICWKF